MKDRIQKLCKRLSRFTLEEIALIAELDETEMEVILQELVYENILFKHGNNYIYNNIEKESRLKKRLPKIFEYHSQETIEMIINCFCAEIPTGKIGLILKPQENCICNFNLYIRKLLFEKQENDLLNYFNKKPQVPRIRAFFGKEFYFYSYNNYIYVCDKLLDCDTSKSFSAAEEKRFKILYSFLTRRLNHNTHKTYIHFYLAEQIWRHKKEYQILKQELTDLLF